MTDSPKTIVHLICGATGAGKTTYSKTFCAEHRLARFAVDEWMLELFGPDLSDPMDWPWISERALRCEAKILKTALDLAECGVPSVLEIGLAQSERRAQIAGDIKQRGCEVQLHYLDVDPAERWRRVAARNQTADGLSGIRVSRPVFDFFEQRWEPPGEVELTTLNGSVVGTAIGS